jgi:hypothetical protein
LSAQCSFKQHKFKWYNIIAGKVCAGCLIFLLDFSVQGAKDAKGEISGDSVVRGSSSV